MHAHYTADPARRGQAGMIIVAVPQEQGLLPLPIREIVPEQYRQ